MRVKFKDTFPLYIDYLYKSKKSHSTIRNYKHFLGGALSHTGLLNKPISHLRLTDVASVIEMGATHGQYGSQKAVSIFRQLCKFLHLSGYKLAFDWRDIELPKVPVKYKEAFTIEELNQVLDNFDLENPDWRKALMAYSMKALCETLFSTGTRISEALSLTLKNWKDILKNKYTIIVGKGNQEGIIYFTDRAIYWIKKYLEIRNEVLKNNSSESLFVNANGGSLNVGTAKSFLWRYRNQFEFKNKITFHTFRRTLATMLIYNKADIKSVQSILRHKSERTTLRYYVMADKRQAEKTHKKIVEKLLVGT